MSHTARTTSALGRWKRPSARLTALVAVGIALGLQVVPPFGSADAASVSASTVHAVVPVTGVDLQVAMSGPDEAVPVGTFTDTISLTNGGTLPATAVAFDLAMPAAGVTYAISDPAVTCDSAWHCTLADLAPSAQRLVSLTVTTDSTHVAGDEVTPDVTGFATSDVASSNDHAVFTTTLSDQSHLAVAIRRTSGTIIPGGKVTLQATVTNSGPSAAVAPAVVVDAPPYPFALTTKATTSSDGTCAPYGRTGDWSCTWPTIAPGANRKVSFALTASEFLVKGSSFITYAEAGAGNTVGDISASDVSPVSDVTNRATDVSVTTTSTPKVKPDKRGDFKVIITNHGPHRAHDVRLVETVPKGFFWKDAKGRVMEARKSRTTSIPFGNLEVGESKELAGWFRYPTGANLDWTSKVTHADPDSKASNNTDTSTTRILGPIVQTVTTSTTSDDTVVSTTKTSSGSTSDSDTDVDGFKYDGSEQAVEGSSSSGDKEVLADTGGPALHLPLLGFTLVLLGAVSSAKSRQLRPAPRHRAWVSPYA